MDPEIEQRMRKGAAMLGELWRAGDRCARGWDLQVAAIPEEANAEEAVASWACQCPVRNRFCKAKIHWLKLALTELREPIDGAYGLSSMMNAAEWDLTGLTRKMEFPGVGVITIGSNGVMSAADLDKLREAPETLDSVVKLLKAFPKAKIAAVQQPAPPPPPPPEPAAAQASDEEKPDDSGLEDDFATREAG